MSEPKPIPKSKIPKSTSDQPYEGSKAQKDMRKWRDKKYGKAT